MKKYLMMIGMGLMALTIGAQNFGEIHGKIVDENGEGLPNAYVSTEEGSGGITATTDLDGKFKLKPLNPGIYNITVSFVGYANKTIAGVNVEPNKIKLVGKLVLLEEGGVVTGEVQIVEFVDELIDPEATSVITKRHAEFIKSPLAKTPMKYIATMVPGSYEKDGELYFKGSRQGAVQYQIDGVKMTTNVSNIPSSAIGSISVYTGGIPAKYGDTTGGVVVLETRSYMDLYNEAKYASN